MEDGKFDQSHLREVFLQFAPLPGAGQCVFLGVDTSNLVCPDAQTAADRTLVPLANLPEKAHVVCPGRVINSITALPEEAGQGTFVLDTQRVTSTALATGGADSQLRAVVDLLVKRGLWPVIIGDRWYVCTPFLARMTDGAASCLLRVKSNHVFSRPAPARQAGQRERSCAFDRDQPDVSLALLAGAWISPGQTGAAVG